MKYSTVRAVVLAYQKTGRLNKLLTYSAKEKLLKMRKTKDKKIGFQPWAVYKRKNPKKAPKLNTKLLERVPASEIEDQYSMKLIKQNLATLGKPTSSKGSLKTWIDFNKLTDDVEKCEYEYHIADDEQKMMWCQLSNVFTGTLKPFNIADKIESCSYPKFLNLPQPSSTD